MSAGWSVCWFAGCEVGIEKVNYRTSWKRNLELQDALLHTRTQALLRLEEGF